MSEHRASFSDVRLKSFGRHVQTKGDFDLSVRDAELPANGSFSHEQHWQKMREIVLRERLLAYCEDLAEWFAGLFHLPITAENFGPQIEDGVLLCKLARLIELGEKSVKTRGFASSGRKSVCPPAPLNFNEKPTTAFHKRDNVTTFIRWAKQLEVADAVLFEADDLVGHKNEKNVLYCLMELARIQNGVEPPRLIQMERLIDSGQVALGSETEERNAVNLIRDVLVRMRYHDTRVERVGPGRYDIADLGELNIGILRSHVMVRLPNSWDTLEHYVMTAKRKPADANGRRRSIGGPPTPAPASAPKAAPPAQTPDELTELKRLLDDKDRQIRDLDGALRECSASHDNATTRANELEAERQRLLGKQRDLHQRNAELEGKLVLYNNSDGDKKDLMNHIDDLEKQLQDKDTQLDQRKRELDKLKLELEEAQLDLEQQVDERVRDAGEAAVRQKRLEEDLNARVGEMQRRMNELEEDEKGQEEEINDLRAELEHQQAKSAALQAEKQKAIDTAKGLSDELDRLREAVRRLEEQLRELQKRLAAAEQELASLRNQLAAAQKSLDEERAKRAEAEGKCVDLKQQLDREAQKHSQAVDALKRSHEAELGDANKKLDKAEALNEQYEHANKDLENKLDAESKLNETLRDKLTATAAEVTRLEHENQARVSELEHAHGELERKLNDHMRRSSSELDLLNNQHAARGARAEALLKESDELLEASRAEAEDLAKQLREVKDALAKSQIENEDLKRQVGELQQRLGGDMDRTRQDLNTALGQNAELKHRLEHAEEQLRATNDETKDLTGKLEDAVVKGKGFERAAAEAQDKNDTLARQLREAQEKLQRQNDELAALKKKSDDDDHNLAAANARIADLTEQLKEALAAANKSQTGLAEENSILQQKLKTKDRLFEESEKKLLDEIANLQEQLTASNNAKTLTSAEKAAAEKAAQEQLHARDERLRAANDQAVALEDQLRKAEEEIARLAEVEKSAQEMQALLRRPSVIVHPAVINANRLEAELLTEPQLELLAAIYDKVVEAVKQRELSRAPFEAAEVELQKAAHAYHNNASPQTQAALEAAKEARDRAGQQFANDDWLLTQTAKRAIEDLRLAQIHEGGGPMDNEASDLPLMGLSSVDAVIRIAELERMLQEHGDQHAQLQQRVVDLETQKLQLETQKLQQPPERDDLRLYRENIADWLNALLSTNLTEKNLMENLEDGRILCAAGNVIDQTEQQLRSEEKENGYSHDDSREVSAVPDEVLKAARARQLQFLPYADGATRGSPEAKKNVEDFIAWARGVGIADPDIFTPDNLLQRTDDWAVLVGLFDLARLTRGLPLPALVALERAQALARSTVPAPVKNDPIDQVVNQVMQENPNFRVRRVAQGRYIFGQKVLLMRILQGTVMVRVGGGWEELRAYLLKHASRSHKTPQAASEADAAVEAIRQSAGGVGLHTTRTRVRGPFE